MCILSKDYASTSSSLLSYFSRCLLWITMAITFQFNSKMTALKLFIFTNAISLFTVNTVMCNNFTIQNIVCLTYNAICSQLQYLVMICSLLVRQGEKIDSLESKGNIPVQQ
jgi:hypothetical protein